MLGDLAPDAVLGGARQGGSDEMQGRLTESTFFVAQYHLIAGNREGAIEAFRQTIDLDLQIYANYFAARYELERLNAR